MTIYTFKADVATAQEGLLRMIKRIGTDMRDSEIVEFIKSNWPLIISREMDFTAHWAGGRLLLLTGREKAAMDVLISGLFRSVGNGKEGR